MTDDVHSAADDRTLRLSSHPIDATDVDALIKYQRSLRDELEFSPVCYAGWTEQLAEAHRRALKESALDPGRYARVSSVATELCGRRLTVRALQRRLSEERERVAKLDRVNEEDRELIARLSTEIARLDDLSTLQRRHGEATIAALREREQELVSLHETLSPLLAKGTSE